MAACLRPARSARSVFGFGPGDVPASSGLSMLSIGLHGALPCDAACFVLARAGGLQLAPQVERAPAFFDDAADEVVDEGKLRLDQSQRVFGFDDKIGGNFFPTSCGGNSSAGTGTSCCASSARWVSIRVASADRRIARSRSRATASSGGSTGKRLSPAAKCG